MATTATTSHVIVLEDDNADTVVGAGTGALAVGVLRLGEEEPKISLWATEETELRIACVSALDPPVAPEELAPEELLDEPT